MKIQRWRIRFSKREAMRFTGHLDLVLTWERTFRRSGLPLSYSEGFSPRPVINLAAPLPLGFISRGELGDFWLSEKVSADQFEGCLRDSLPPGLEVSAVEEIPEIHGDKLPNLVRAAEYSMLCDPKTGIERDIRSFLDQREVLRERKGKSYDLRSRVISLELSPNHPPGKMLLLTTLTLLPGSTGRPDELLKELEIPVYQSLICRERILLKDAGS